MKLEKKKCTDCEREKLFSDFYKREGGKYYSRCKKCISKKRRSRSRILVSVFKPGEIAEMLFSYLDLREVDLVSKKAPERIALRRHIVIYFLNRITRATLKEMSDLVGVSNHTSSIYAIKKITSLRKMHKPFNAKMSMISGYLKGENARYYFEERKSYFFKYKWLDIESTLKGTVRLRWSQGRKQKAKTGLQNQISLSLYL